VDGQDEGAGRGSIETRGFVVGDELDAMNDAAFLVKIDQVVGRESGDTRNTFERIEPESIVGIWSEALDEDFHGLEGFRLRIDDGDAGDEAAGTGLVVDAVFGRRHWALVTATKGAPEM
jgi:hypothetical protein